MDEYRAYKPHPYFGLLIALLSSMSDVANAQLLSSLQQQLIPTDSVGRELGADLDADGRTLVAGGSSRVYVYEFGPKGWTNSQVLSPLSQTLGQNDWGYGVAISGNFVAIGSQAEKNQNGSTGAVHIYRRAIGNSWVFAQTVVSPESTDSELFGASIDLDGDQLIIGDPSHRFGGPFPQGAAFAFTWNGSSFVFDEKLYSTTQSLSENFSQSLSLQGNWLLIGAPQADHNQLMNDSGAVYVYQRIAGSWTMNTRLEAQNPQTDARFGQTLSLADDFAIIGSPTRTVNSEALAGAVHILRRPLWTEDAFIASAVPTRREYFGGAVSVVGNLAIASRPSHAPLGSARVLKRQGDSWQIVEDLVAADGEAPDAFGSSVLVHRDQLIVSAASDDIDTQGSGTVINWGSIYIFGGGDVTNKLFADGFE